MVVVLVVAVSGHIQIYFSNILVSYPCSLQCGFAKMYLVGWFSYCVLRLLWV